MTRSSLRRAHRLLLGLGVVVCLTVPGAATATAATPAPGSLSDVEVSGRQLRAVLTAPAGRGDVTITPWSVVATMQGRSLPVAVSPVQQEGRSALLVIDTSGSMGARGIAAARQAAGAYLSQAPDDVRVGLVTFADAPHLLVPPTSQRATVRAALGRLTAQGETTLYDAMQLALQRLGSSGSRNIILLSDGGDTRSRTGLAPLIRSVQRSGARVEVVGFRTDESQNSVLTSLASAGNGGLVAAGDAGALRSAFSGAARALSSQVRVTVTTPEGLSGRQPLSVRALVGQLPISAQTSVTLPKVSAIPPVADSPTPASTPTVEAAASPAPRTVPPARPGVWVWAAAAAVFAGLLMIVLAIVSPVFISASRRRIQALELYLGAPVDSRRTVASASPSAVGTQVLQMSERLTRGREATVRTARLLERADLPLRTNEWYVLRAFAVAAGVFGGVLLLNGALVLGVLGGLLGGAVGYVLPGVVLKVLASRRAKRFERQLPDVLTLLASSLATGFSLPQAIDAIVRDAAEPAAKEFSRALAETRIGADLEDSLDRLALRMDSDNLRWTTMAIRIQRQVGGNLAETLRTTATTLRSRESLQREVSALSAEGRLSAYILIALPVGVFFFMLKANREYVSLLWTNPIGWLMSAGGLVALGVGVVWMKRVVKVEV
jgi:tight adherence protein B